MQSATPYTYASAQSLCCAGYVFPLVTRLALEAQPPPARLLDAGCGNGALARPMVAEGYDVTGVDLSSDGIEVARSVCPGSRFEVAAVDDEMLARLAVDPFDIVVCTEVVEHLYDPHSFVRGARDALRPGGTIIVSTPYHGRVKNTLLAAAGRFDEHVGALENGGHVKFFSRATLTRLLSQHGFGDVRFYGCGRLPLVWKSMVMTARKPGA